MPLPSDSSITFRSTDMLKWGVGKGSPLTKEEVDNNFWYILVQLADLAMNAPEPKDIQSITVANGKMTITLSDGITTFGPFDLPTNAFNWTGAFVGGATYHRMDILTSSDGAYLVLQDHTAASTFDPAATNISGALYQLMFSYQNVYDLSFFYPGLPGTGLGVGDAMFALVFARDAFLPLDLIASQGAFLVAPTSLWSADIQKNGSTIGTVSYDPGASVPAVTFSFGADVQFAAGDILSIIRPTAIDATAKGFALTLAAKKGTI